MIKVDFPTPVSPRRRILIVSLFCNGGDNTIGINEFLDDELYVGAFMEDETEVCTFLGAEIWICAFLGGGIETCTFVRDEGLICFFVDSEPVIGAFVGTGAKVWVSSSGVIKVFAFLNANLLFLNFSSKQLFVVVDIDESAVVEEELSKIFSLFFY